MKPRDVIVSVLDQYNVEDFVDEEFNDLAADKILEALAHAGYSVVKDIGLAVLSRDIPLIVGGIGVEKP